MPPDISPRFGGIRDAHVASRDEEGRVRRRRRGNQSPPTSPIPFSSSSARRRTGSPGTRPRSTKGKRGYPSIHPEPRPRSLGRRRDERDERAGRGACVVEGWEYDKYSVSTHHTATSVTKLQLPPTARRIVLKSRLGDLGPRSARRDLVEGRVRNLTPRARGTPRVATFGPRDRCAPVKGRARSVTRGRRGL